jgi:hypothetical protein
LSELCQGVVLSWSQSVNSLRQRTCPGNPLNGDCSPAPLGWAAGSPRQRLSITCLQPRVALLPSHMCCSRWRCMGRSKRGRTLSWPSLRPMEPIRVGGSRKEGWEEAYPFPKSPLALLGLDRKHTHSHATHLCLPHAVGKQG